MNDELKALFDAAYAIAPKAYAPYSGFSVGAAIRTVKGQIYTGCNVENAAYPVGTCAEAGAIAAMIAVGDTTIADIAIVSPNANPCMPCGGCRQRISEFSTAATRIHVLDQKGEALSYAVVELLPFAFGPGALP